MTTLRLPARGMASAKVILLGEHAVVYGRPALAAAMDRTLAVILERAGGRDSIDAQLGKALVCAARLAGVEAGDLTVMVESTIPAAVGLGSSAALSVALVRALAAAVGESLDREETCRRAFEIEKIYHGRPSGIDNTVVAHGGIIVFQPGAPVRPIVAPQPLPIVVALGQTRRETKKVVSELRRRWQEDPSAYESLFDEIAEIVREGCESLARADWPGLGRLMDANHVLLRKIGVSTAELDDLVRIARDKGALGAKLTGGGGGGAIVALCPEDPAGVCRAFQANGFDTFFSTVTASLPACFKNENGRANAAVTNSIRDAIVP